MNFRRYNPFPLPILGLFLIIFLAGYFIGGASAQLANTTETRKTCNFIHPLR